MTYRLKVVELKNVPASTEVLTDREAQEYEAFKIDKRRNEWLAGRYALKLAACELLLLK